MKTYLVTGGAGFIGANFVRFMLGKEDCKIVNVDALTYAGNLDNLTGLPQDRHIFVKADICDKNVIDELFQKYDFDRVIHFAAESHVDRSIEDPEVFVRTNVMGTMNLLNTAKKYWQDGDGYKKDKRYLQVSTDEVYGSLGETGYFTEKTPITPHSPYSASKAAADFLVLSYYDTFKMPVIVTRCSNNYGPYQFPEKLVPLMINNVLNLKPLPVYGDGKNVRDWLYVEDHVKAIDIAAENGRDGEVYNIGGHNEKYNIDIVKIIIETVAQMLPESDERKSKISNDLITYVADRKGHDLRYAIDPEKISSELGWKPETNFETGIKKTIKWYLENTEWIEKITSGEYQNYYSKMYANR
ncbi:MAG: dTDP-glucose 4,6-dehydratase [Clostridiales bacterium]|jgi:dTDP-glucose 4,6-dehydratase|nr:dTDP-glucose 4,6-dehydratase [Clostridiales bacterium]